MHLLFPGRHHLLTNFQHDYLHSIIHNPLPVTDVNEELIKIDEKIESVVFAVTSANHSNTRRNPLPFYLRAIAIHDFASTLDVPFYIYGIDDVGSLPNFANYTLKRLQHESEGLLNLNPSNTLVVCSTSVLKMYDAIGFKILPAELTSKTNWTYKQLLPWYLVEQIVENDDWDSHSEITENIHPASLTLWRKYKIDQKVKLLFRDRMVGEDGDITTTRDYNSYVRQMDEIAALKYLETAGYIRAGRIGDIGCAVGSWIRLAGRESRLRESDFYGIEIARHLYTICNQRKNNGEFENPFVFFAQRNAVTGLVFEATSMNTIHTSSLTHEIESYGSREELLQFIQNRYEELVNGGIWINRDVVGPYDKENKVLMKLSRSDGRNDDYKKSFEKREDLREYLKGLSTYGRFLRFIQDFRKEKNYKIEYKVVSIEETDFIEIQLKDACEFMSRKDYIDNWESEMHETFCFWSFSEWKKHLRSVGFNILPQSKAYTNEWIVENRFKDKVELFEVMENGLTKIAYPVTNMILLAEKP